MDFLTVLLFRNNNKQLECLSGVYARAMLEHAGGELTNGKGCKYYFNDIDNSLE